MPRKFAVLILTLVIALLACGTASADSLVGTWHSSSPRMVAYIQGSAIEIDLRRGGDSALYWRGTMFPSVRNNTRIVSIGDTYIMSLSVFGSQDSRKKFLYRNGVLSFKFSILGMTQKVRLRR